MAEKQITKEVAGYISLDPSPHGISKCSQSSCAIHCLIKTGQSDAITISKEKQIKRKTHLTLTQKRSQIKLEGYL